MTPTLLRGDCLELMDELAANSCHLVLADLPYGTTEAPWDRAIPFDPLWARYRRVLRPGGAIVLTAQQPFTSKLVASNFGEYRYSWIWRKNRPTGFANAKKRPLKSYEDVVVFCDRPPPYFPQGLRRLAVPRGRSGAGGCETMPGRGFSAGYRQTWTGYPANILEFPCERGHHPTQKPVALMEYLVRTYTGPGDVVLDNTMGSGTTGVACVRSGRNFIGIERDPVHFETARRRIGEALPAEVALALAA